MSSVLDHVSSSQLDMWQRCPRQWEFRYVKGIKIPPAGTLIEGRCYHKSLEVNFTQKITSLEDLPVEHCLDVFATEWAKALSEEQEVDWQGKDPGLIKDQGYGLVEAYMNSIAPKVQPIEVEEWYISDITGVPFVMRIDLVDFKGTVVDHKTSSRSYVQSDVDRDMQASAAAFVLDRSIIFENHVAVKSTTPRIQVVKTVRTREDINWWLTASAAIVTLMKSGIAPPRPTGWWCSPEYCGFYKMCRGDLFRTYSI